MLSSLFHTLFYNPIYNALVAFMALIPGGDVGVAVILVTLIIRLILLPFSLSAARTQHVMKRLEPQLKELKERHKGDKEKEALETLALYREAKVNPFASILTVFIQIPVLLALFWVFRYEPFSVLDTAKLYALTPLPHAVSLSFLGIISVTSKSMVLALLAGVTQYIQAHIALLGSMKPSDTKGFQGDFQRLMGMQLKYFFPFLIAMISYSTSGAIALYFVTTNCAGILQEIYIRKKLQLG
jgi:YidC/Oxa1 family membrane protein insertase